MINLYIGHDPRETVGTHVFVQSLLKHSTVPVTVMFLHKPMLRRAFNFDVAEGTNAFTVSRFLIPFIQDWTRMAIFMDGADMLLRADIAELVDLYDPWKAVQVVKHDYQSKHAYKYVGTKMEAENEHYQRKNWASVMVMNCGHYAWRKLTPQYMKTASKLELLNFSWMPDEYIGELPKEWNWLFQEYGPNKYAKVLHATAGIPLIDAYSNDEHAVEWKEMLEAVNAKP